MDFDDWFFGGIVVFTVAVVIGVFGLVGVGIYDTVLERRAFDQITACESQRGVPRRQSLTTHVVCVPENARQDTSTVNFNVTQRDSSVREFAKDLGKLQSTLKQSAK